MNANTEPETDSAELTKQAVNYVLRRIHEDENIRYHMGAGTEAFERLKAAQAAATGISPEAVEEEIFGFALKRKACAVLIEEIKDVLKDHADGEISREAALSKIAATLDQ